jgi:biopolymer transport protein ExbD
MAERENKHTEKPQDIPRELKKVKDWYMQVSEFHQRFEQISRRGQTDPIVVHLDNGVKYVTFAAYKLAGE